MAEKGLLARLSNWWKNRDGSEDILAEANAALKSGKDKEAKELFTKYEALITARKNNKENGQYLKAYATEVMHGDGKHAYEAGIAAERAGNIFGAIKMYQRAEKYYKTKNPEKAEYAEEKIEALGEKLNGKRLENNISEGLAITGIIGITASLFFLSSNITGRAIGALNQTEANWIGVILFVIGLIGALGYFLKKK